MARRLLKTGLSGGVARPATYDHRRVVDPTKRLDQGERVLPSGADVADIQDKILQTIPLVEKGWVAVHEAFVHTIGNDPDFRRGNAVSTNDQIGLSSGVRRHAYCPPTNLRRYARRSRRRTTPGG